MSIADELHKLEELHRSGALSDEEYAQAKVAVLGGAAQMGAPANQNRPLFPINPCERLTPNHLRVMHITAGALLMGVVAFLGIALYIVQVQNNGQGMNPPQNLPIVTLVAVAFLALIAPLAFIVPSIMTRSALRRILAGKWTPPPGADAGMYAGGGAKLWAVHQSTMIVGLALLEGSAFLGGIAYLLEAQPLTLGVVGVAIVLMLCQFPTEQRVRAWLERQAAVLTQMHQQAVQFGKQ
jgi:hypothetical protein